MDQIPDSAQHYIECDTESCGKFSEFYCNTCHQRTCDVCREVHLKQNSEHEIVLYQERKRKVPSEKCRIHPTENINFFCDDCQAPSCSTCLALDHSDHADSDLETVYNGILQQCQKELNHIWKTVIPKAKDDVSSLGTKKEYTKKELAKLRLSMKKRADELKETVNTILADHNKKIAEIENSVLVDLEEKKKKTEDYIYYLEKMITDYERTMPSIKPTELLKFHTDILLSSLKMPDLSKPKLPIFTPGTLNEEEIATHFGEIEINSSEEMNLSSSVTKVNDVTLPGYDISHLSPLPSDEFWVSEDGALIQSDMKGNILQKIPTNTKHILGYHTVTKEGELLYTDSEKRVIYRVTSDMSTNKLISTGDWGPGAIYSSHINGHILVGMKRKNNMKIVRYNSEGKKLLIIQWNDKGETLYQSICFITENINGDICTSDNLVREVVVVTGSGKYRFSYAGQQSQSGFYPYGICTNVLGHILVCNGYIKFGNHYSCIHLLDMDGQFLSVLLTPDQCPPLPRALCIDKQHNLWVGSSHNVMNRSKVSVYKYLQNT